MIQQVGDNSTEPLLWSKYIKYPNMVRIRIPMDGSCFFHAILMATNKYYRGGMINNVPINRHDVVINFRKSLGNKLQEIISSDPEIKYYHTLSEGNILEKSKKVPEYSLDNMVKELMSPFPIDSFIFQEFISNMIGRNIYFLDNETTDVYINHNEYSRILYKNRPSIVLLYLPGHFDLIGINSGTIQTEFPLNDPFIQTIHTRMNLKMVSS